MLIGNNSIIGQAENATILTKQAQLEEDVDFAYLSYTGQIIKTNDLDYYLNKIDNANVEKLAIDTWCVSRGASSVTVSNNGEKLAGKTAIWDGTSEESPEFKEFNWYIYTPAQLKFLADFVNNGNELTSDQETLISNAGYSTSDVKMEETTMVYLMNNLDFGARAGTGESEKQKWETESNEARKWTPIGYGDGNNQNKRFIGTFEGNGFTIKGIYVNRTEDFSGLFGNSKTIKNLTICNSYINGGRYIGSIVGALRGGSLENCHNLNSTVTGTYVVGGIVGQSNGNFLITNCSNKADITVTGVGKNNVSGAGGIVAYSKNSSITYCYNFGNISSAYNIGLNIGGICGEQNCNLEEATSFNYNYNSGTISGLGNCGGLIGYCHNNVTIEKNYNKGQVSIANSSSTLGNIIGKTDGDSATVVNDSYYLNTLDGKAIMNTDYEENNVKGISNDESIVKFV